MNRSRMTVDDSRTYCMMAWLAAGGHPDRFDCWWLDLVRTEQQSRQRQETRHRSEAAVLGWKARKEREEVSK
jgi:hypothetical protein